MYRFRLLFSYIKSLPLWCFLQKWAQKNTSFQRCRTVQINKRIRIYGRRIPLILPDLSVNFREDNPLTVTCCYSVHCCEIKICHGCPPFKTWFSVTVFSISIRFRLVNNPSSISASMTASLPYVCSFFCRPA